MIKSGHVKRHKRAPRLAIFDTFKTNTKLTKEAGRQRSIIGILAAGGNPSERTRTAIARSIGESNGIPWKNIYSGGFRDFDETLIPLGLVQEAGRLPLKRGPRVLQEAGVPFYDLTESGRVVTLAFDSEGRSGLLRKFDGDEQAGVLAILGRYVPGFVFSVFERYVHGYCEGRIDGLVPLSLERIRLTQGKEMATYEELIRGISKMNKNDKAAFVGFLDSTGQ